MANLAKLLQTDMSLPDMVKRLAAAGRGKDSILAHINPKEAALLKSRGGKGRPNPETGIIEFDEEGTGDAISYAQEAPAPEAAAPAPSFDQGFESAPSYAYQPSADFGIPSPELGGTTAAPAVAQAPQGPPPASIMRGLPGQLPGYGVSAAPIAPEQAAPAAAPGEAQKDTLQQTLAKAGGRLQNQLGQDPLAFLKAGGGIATALQGRKAAGQVAQQSQANEAEIRKLADPYRQQGQQLMNLGQAGQLTAPQQQALEAQRAAIQQQLAQSGVTGGTAQMQAEQALSRVAQQYAQDNIKQGVALMGTADKYITDAIQAGYTGAKDAASITKDFYSQIASMLPTTAGGPPTVAPKG